MPESPITDIFSEPVGEKIQSSPAVFANPVSYRLLETGEFRLLETGDFRLNE